MRLTHNLMSLGVYKNYSHTLNKQSESIAKISSGVKLNGAKDNPNALGRSEQFRIQIRGLQMAKRNMQDCASMVQTFDGAISNISEELIRIKELTVQAGTAGVTKEDRQTIQKEIDSLLDHVDNVAKNTEFNGVKLLNGNGKNKNPEILKAANGMNRGDTIDIPVYSLTVDTLGLKNIDLFKDDIGNTLKKVDSAIKETTNIRSKYGALQQRLETSVQNIESNTGISENARSGIEDTDVAYEVMNLAKANILIQTSTSLMAQSNQFPNDSLRILERVK